VTRRADSGDDAANGLLWSELPRWRVEIELAKVGTTPDYLVRDAEDEPELQAEMELLSSPEAKLRRALQYFGDEGNPQPENREPRVLAGWDDGRVIEGALTPDWGQLPRLPPEMKKKPGPEQETHGRRSDKSKGTRVRYDLAERGLLLHVKNGLGRRKLPGLGEWEAGQVIKWHDKVGKPTGLWFDETDRLHWGPAITSESDDDKLWLRLPPLLKGW